MVQCVSLTVKSYRARQKNECRRDQSAADNKNRTATKTTMTLDASSHLPSVVPRCKGLDQNFVDSLLRCGILRLYPHARQTLATRLTFAIPVFVTIWRCPLS